MNKLKAIIGIITGKINYDENIVSVKDIHKRFEKLFYSYIDNKTHLNVEVSIDVHVHTGDLVIQTYSLYSNTPSLRAGSLNLEELFKLFEKQLINHTKKNDSPSKTIVIP